MGHQMSPFYHEGNNSFFVADVDKLLDMDFSESQLVFINLVNVSKHYFGHRILPYIQITIMDTIYHSYKITFDELMESAIQAISQSAKDPWTLVLYNPSTVLPLEEIEKTCNLFGAKHTRVVTICSTIKADDKFLEIHASLH